MAASDAEVDALSNRIFNALADAIQAGEIAGGGMPDKFVLVASTIDSDGDHRVFLSANPGAETTETLGLLDGAQAVWRAGFVREHLGPKAD